MKVKHNSEQRLVIQFLPLFRIATLATALLGFLVLAIYLALGEEPLASIPVFFIAIGIIFYALEMVERATLTLDRDQGTIQIRGKNMSRTRKIDLPLTSLLRAEVEGQAYRSAPTAYRPMLIIQENEKDMRYPVVVTYGTGDVSHKAVEAINTWNKTEGDPVIVRVHPTTQVNDE